MGIIEIIAVIFGLLTVYLTIKQNIWLWPTGIIMTVLYIYIFFIARLYPDVILQIICTFIQIYGWYHWLYKGTVKRELPISKLSKQKIVFWICIALITTFIWGYIMHSFTNSNSPFGDSFIVAMSLVAQWLLVKKNLENWLGWISVDIVAIYVYFSNHLYPTTILYIVFLYLALQGYKEWKKEYQKLPA